MSVRAGLAYVAMIVVAVALFLAIDAAGSQLATPAGETTLGKSSVVAKSSALVHVLITLAAVVALGQFFGMVLLALGQPPVIGEVLAGIALGPSLLGQIWPEAARFVLPAEVAPTLGVIAQLGVILYMFLVGLELNPAALRRQAHVTVMIAHAGTLAPFVLGSTLALFLYPRLAPAGVPFTSFTLFFGVAMSITAFPVLARILSDRGLTQTPLGVLALGCAALGDVTAWCVLAFVVSVAQAQVAQALLVVGLTFAFFLVMILLVRPILVRVLENRQTWSPGLGATILTLLLLSALTTELIGIHALFGAFLLGAIIPHDSPLAEQMAHKLEDVVTIVFLPAFFAFTGMRTAIGLVSGVENWLMCGMIIGVATLGKFGGTYICARRCGLDAGDSARLGTLMNTRGLMEIIVLNVGLDMKVISPTLFAMMVLMALATTLATTPILQWIGTPSNAQAEPAP